MVWIESHDTLAGHFKTSRLAALLEVSRPTAIGHLHLLWWWAMRYAPDGRLARFQAREIADAAEWNGDPDAFVGACVTAEFLDKKPLRIHDWEDYAGKLIAQKERNRARMRAARAGDPPSIKDARARNVQRTSGERAGLPDLTGPDQTGPNRTGPNRTGPGHDAAAAAVSFSPAGGTDVVADVFAYFRERINPNARSTAEREIGARLERWTPDELRQAIDHFAAHSWWMAEHGHEPATWFFKSDERIEQFVNLRASSNGQARAGPLSWGEALQDAERFNDDQSQRMHANFMKAYGPKRGDDETAQPE